MHNNQWFTWTDSTNKIYANLKLTGLYGVTTLPTETAVNTKLKELQDAWDAENGG